MSSANLPPSVQPRKRATLGGPRLRKPRAAKPAPIDELARLNEVQALIQASLEDDKAEEIVVIDLVGRAAFVERMVIANGLADRQITAMAGHLERKLREIGVKGVTVEGAHGSDWVLVDAGDILVHLFKPDARVAYGLEKMWSRDLD